LLVTFKISTTTIQTLQFFHPSVFHFIHFVVLPKNISKVSIAALPLPMFRFPIYLRASSIVAILAVSIWDPNRNYLLNSQFIENQESRRDLKIIKDKFRELKEKYNPPKHPIVLCHGLSGFDTLTLFQAPQFAWNNTENFKEYGKRLNDVSNEVGSGSVMLNYWYGIEEALKEAGCKVLTAKVPPFGTIEERAKLLDALLTEKCKEYPDKVEGERLKINLVGHSMGGLDSRYLISKIQSEDSPYEVVSLTTVGTPHHGSECADFLMSWIQNDDTIMAVCPKAIPQLTSKYLKEFNREVRNKPGVMYFSYGALMNPHGIKLFRATYEIIKSEIMKKGLKNIENDGMVSVDLARWGNYMGTLEDVDHMDLINWTNRIRATVDKVMFNQKPSFNAIALYLDIAETLSKNRF